MNIRILLIFLSLSYSGCSLIYSYSDNLPQRINQWVIEKKYNIALNTINYIKPSHKDYRILQQQKIRIQKKMTAYEAAAIEKSKQMIAEGNWVNAFTLLDEVEDNIIDKKNIELHRKELLSKRNNIISNFENEILNNQAVDLIGKIEFYNKIKKIVSENESNKLNISQFDRSRNETSLQLAKRSEQQYREGQYSKALSAIELALKLRPEDDIVLRLNKIKSRIQDDIKRKRLSYVNEAKTLVTKLSQGYSYDILNETKEKIVWLNKIKGNEKVYLDLLDKLKTHLKAGEKQHFEAARKLYSDGKTQEALIIWLELKKLNPDHPKLQSNIKRAEKILNKLEQLSNKPAKKK